MVGRALFALVAVVGCRSTDPAPPVPIAAPPVTQAIALGLTPSAVDPHGVPRLLAASAAYRGPHGPPREAAVDHVIAIARAWGVAPEAVPALAAIGEVPVRVGAGTGAIVRVRPQLDDLPIDGGELRVLVSPGGDLIAASGALIGNDAPRGPARFAVDDAGAIAVAVGVDRASASLTRDGARYRGRAGALDIPAAKATRSWLHHGERLVAGWVVEAYVGRADSTSSDLIRARVDGDGRVLDTQSLVADVAFGYRVFAETTGDLRPLDGPIVDVSPHPTGVPDGNFPAFVAPSLISVDGLNHPANSSVPDSWLAATRTETNGNNVEAYADLNPPSGLTFGDFRATLTGGQTFDRSYDTALGPLTSQDQQMASITSLFYVINWLHDFWYDAGFTEAAGNAQDNNYGRGGEDRDALLAEAQDNALGGSRNNANMATPSDGLQPRMQVFLWLGLDDHSLAFQPSGRTPQHGVAAYGISTFDVTGELVLGDDGSGDNPNDLCEVPAGDVAGKIVLVDRGNCTFESKALRIQQAGGIGMIVANHVDTNPPTMGDDSSLTEPITIAQLSIFQAEGATLKAELASGPVTATMHRLLGPELDGAIDSTLIAHEFGHYLHHRLQQCNNRMCSALSEGWGDFVALLLMARDGDDLTRAYPLAVYATRTFSPDAEYFGIRRAPYSVDPGVNALSFRHMSADTTLPDTHPFVQIGVPQEVHNAGEVWTAALWEAYVALQQARGSATFDATRSAMAHYVVAGLLLAPVDGTPTETRDAILIAARAASQADHDTLAAAFARRGLGSCAVSPPRASTDFTGIVESLEVRANMIVDAPVLAVDESCDSDDVIDAGEHGRLQVAVANRGGKPLLGATATLRTTTPGVVVSGGAASFDLEPYATTTLAFEIALDAAITEPVAGTFELELAGPDACTPAIAIPVALRLNVDDQVSQSTTDTFDAALSPWQDTFSPTWAPVRETALDGAWRGTPPATFSDGSLESPLLTGGSGPTQLSFEHRYAFEASADAAFDGGVLELSLDGVIWQDISNFDAAVPYGPLVLTGAGQPLSGRRGFTGQNPSYPATDVVTLQLGSTLADQKFKIRFRIASDNSNASEGWTVDNVALTNLAGTPFPVQVANVRRCDGTPPTDGGDQPPPPGDGGCCGTGSGGGGATAISAIVLAVLRRRRRR